MTRWTVHFSGRVQGVGFRYTTVSVARRFDVTGYVSNLSDGRVLLVAEGAAQTVSDFVEAVCEQMRDHVRSHSVDRTAASGEFQGFVVRH